MSDPNKRIIPTGSPTNELTLPTGGKRLRLEITHLNNIQHLPGRISGISTVEGTQGINLTSNNNIIRIIGTHNENSLDIGLTQDRLIQLEQELRGIAFSSHERILLGLRNSTPVVEVNRGQFLPFFGSSNDPLKSALLNGISRGGVYQLMRFPISRFNGVSLPNNQIRFADPSRWFHGLMESRLFTITQEGTNKYYSWDAHNPVGNHPHNFYHVNQKGMYSSFGHSNHTNLSGISLVQARQLRYLKIGGRVFLVVGVIVDAVQLGAATNESFKQGSVRPIAAQTVRTAGSWGMAWAGAKAGLAIGAVAGIETGPGLVLTAIGGGIVGGFAGYLGADWIADWIYEN